MKYNSTALRLIFSQAFLLVFLILLTGHQVFANSWGDAHVVYTGDKAITVYRSPHCDCCHKWIKHLERHDFVVEDKTTSELGMIKSRFGVPRNMASCHTAIIDGYVIEGHVPADDIKRLLLDRPQITGLSVPQMPVGTPGMEVGDRKDDFAVIQFKTGEEPQIYRQYSDY
ncbi:MAG: DUF411 domain-containing protein [Gammaproteobacteria bacterium]